jgi:hypothetical protein
MALLTDAVPPCRIEFRRIHDVAMRLQVLLPGAVTTFTPDAAFQKRWVEIAVLCIRYRLRAAGMAVQAWFLNRLCQFDIVLAGIAG